MHSPCFVEKYQVKQKQGSSKHLPWQTARLKAVDVCASYIFPLSSGGFLRAETESKPLLVVFAEPHNCSMIAVIKRNTGITLEVKHSVKFKIGLSNSKAQMASRKRTCFQRRVYKGKIKYKTTSSHWPKCLFCMPFLQFEVWLKGSNCQVPTWVQKCRTRLSACPFAFVKWEQ